MTLDGMMTFGQLENGLHRADFQCIENVRMEPFAALCKVQVMRDGNVYVTEQKRRKRNKALYRGDNCSLSLGKNGMYYFVFTMSAVQAKNLPTQLCKQAQEIAIKFSFGNV